MGNMSSLIQLSSLLALLSLTVSCSSVSVTDFSLSKADALVVIRYPAIIHADAEEPYFHAFSINAIVGEWIRQRSCGEVIHAFGPEGADIPCARVATPEELIQDPQLRALKARLLATLTLEHAEDHASEVEAILASDADVVVVNLGTNDFSTDGDTVRLELGREDSLLRLGVSNPGPPLPERMRYQMFDSMVSMRPGQDARHLGLGLKELVPGIDVALEQQSLFGIELRKDRVLELLDAHP